MAITSYRRHPSLFAAASTFGLGAAVVIGFLAEGLISKSNIPYLRIGFVMHMWLTLCFLTALGLLWLHRPAVRVDVHSSLGLSRVRRTIALIAAWSLCGSMLSSEFRAANMAFWLLWTGNLVVVWWVIPALLVRMPAPARLRLILGVLLAVTVGCVLLHPVNGYQQGRLVGMFENASHSGRILAICSVAWFVVWLTGRRDGRVMIALAVSITLLLLTRTRASIGAAALGCGAVYVSVLLDGTSWRRSSVRRRTGIVFGSAVLAGAVLSQVLDLTETSRFLRVEGGIQTALSHRMMNWSRGYGDFWSYGMFGHGFMSRFGDSSNVTNIGGIEFPRYNWQTADDPLNMWMSMAKHTGIPAMLLLGLLLRGIWQLRSQTADLSSRALFTGVFCCGLLFGSFDGNWLMSFGHPVDRLCLVLFAVLGSAPSRGLQTESRPESVSIEHSQFVSRRRPPLMRTSSAPGGRFR